MDDFFDTSGWSFDPGSWWGDSSPVDSAPATDNSGYTNYQYPTNPSGGTPYDDNGNLMPGWAQDENNNPVWTGDSTYNDQTGTTTSGQNPYGQTVYNPDGTTTFYPPGATVPGMGGGTQQGGTRSMGPQQPGQQQPGQQQSKGLLGGLLGGGDQTGGGSSNGLLGTLGMLAAGAGVGALLSNMLGNKSSGSGAGSVTPAHAASIGPSNLSYTQLANPGTNPGYAMGQPVAQAQAMPTNLGHLIGQAPQTIMPVAPQQMMLPGQGNSISSNIVNG